MNGDDAAVKSPAPASSATVQESGDPPVADRLSSHTDDASSSPDLARSALIAQAEEAADQGEDIGPHEPPKQSGGASELSLANSQVEQGEPLGDLGAGSSDQGGSEDAQDALPDGDNELKRVKVYELIGSRWVDQGTAFCFGQFSEETNEALLIARAERNYREVILSTAIRSNDVYQRQQDTLIVWTEPDGVDYALSFQDPDGCAEVWNFILEVQRHMNGGGEDQITLTSSSPSIGPDQQTSVTTASIIRSGHLPQPQLGIIGEIERAIKTLARTQSLKDRICEYIQQQDYVKSLIEVMNTAEDLESVENLHALCSLMQTLLMLNDHGMYEHILEDDIFFGVLGMLEYDPEFPAHKANYREFLHQTSRFHQPIGIEDQSIKRKIHHTYRLQFLKDVVLARVLDDSTFNVLNSCIIFNQIDIITFVQKDQNFLKDVVKLFVDEEMLSDGPKTPAQKNATLKDSSDGDSQAMDVDQKTVPNVEKKTNGGPTEPPSSSWSRAGYYAFSPPEDLSEAEIILRREVVFLIQQLCVMGKNVQLPARMALFRSLVDRGVLFAVQWALALPEKEEQSKVTISTAGEILAALLDHDLNGVRGHVLKQITAIEKEREAKKKGANKAETLVLLLCKMLAQSKDLSVQSQVGEALKVWLEIPQTEPEHHPPIGVKLLGRAKDEPGTERFLDYFYKFCVKPLFEPLYDIPEHKDVTGPLLPLSRERTNLYLFLCELLCNFTIQHSFRSHFYLLGSNVATRVTSLFKARDKHLRHAAFRFFRVLLKMNNRNLFHHMMKHDVLKPILDLTIQESRRDNLLSSSCQEFFEHMRRENMKELIQYTMSNHEAAIRQLAETPLGGTRFHMFIKRWEMNNEPLPKEDKPSAKPVNARPWPGQGRFVEAEEENYFNADDDDDDGNDATASQGPWVGGASASSPQPLNVLKRKRRQGLSSPNGLRASSQSPSLGALVDYDEDEDDLGLALPVGEGRSLTTFGAKNLTIPPRASSEVSGGSTPGRSASPISVSGSSSSSPRLASSPLPPRRPAPDDDEEDNLLEALVRGKSTPPAPSPAPSLASLRPSEKRRRDDDDEGLFERLSKAKKVDLGLTKEGGGPWAAKLGNDPPRKIKVKLGAVTPAPAAVVNVEDEGKHQPMPKAKPEGPEACAKDGDTG